MDHLPIPTKGVLCELQINSNRSIHQTLIYLQSIRIDNHVLNRLSIVSINDVNQICFGILNNSRITHFDRFLPIFSIYVYIRYRAVVKAFQNNG
jgi:hypothetical protein